MAFGNKGVWLIVFRTPADDFKSRHVMRLSAGQSKEKAMKAFRRHANVDAKIEYFGFLESQEQLLQVTAEVSRDPGHRPLAHGEEQLTVAAVARLREAEKNPAVDLEDSSAPVRESLMKASIEPV